MIKRNDTIKHRKSGNFGKVADVIDGGKLLVVHWFNGSIGTVRIELVNVNYREH